MLKNFLCTNNFLNFCKKYLVFGVNFHSTQDTGDLFVSETEIPIGVGIMCKICMSRTSQNRIGAGLILPQKNNWKKENQ